ncbi:MAG: U32 family peptidase [Prevotella sp.]|nr:U32 family peptidase [Prevotella sp.]
MNCIELLSPAKNLECGISAIDHGADAVYIGASKYGARAAAGNSIDDIDTLCQYAHQFGAKVYVTVNTIIYDDEMADTIHLVKQLDDIHVDAILIQDMGLLQKLRATENLRLAIHASTQTDNRTIDKVKWLWSMGVKRVVLARELSISEIEAIHETVPDVELEVFVHGALCVSYSGQCYASWHCFGRSANRGECAQFCRMPFDLKDADGNIIEHQRYLLSLKDMAQLDNLGRLADAGAVSFKIEGRLKDADYVKNVTAAYSERLNLLCREHPDKYQRASMGKCTYTFSPDIKKSFNRGFTSYFANGRRQGMANILSPKSMGEEVGYVKEIKRDSIVVATTTPFSNGDGLCYYNPNGELEGLRINRAEGNHLFPLHMPADLKAGTTLYRNHDQAFDTLLSKPSSVRKVDVRMTLFVNHDSLTLTITDEHGGTRSASVPYSYQQAQRPQEDNISRQLTKLGNTPYSCAHLHIEYAEDAPHPFIPNSTLTELRRNAISAPITRTTQSSPSTPSNLSPLCQRGVIGGESSYLYNAANEWAKQFYREQGIEATAMETDGEGCLLMQCRYCLRHEMGYCSKYTREMPWREPLSLALSDGREFTLRFNCAKCQMEVWKIEK